MAGNTATIGLLRVILSANTAEFDTAMKRVSGSADRLSKNLKGIGRSATDLGSSLTKTITLPLVGLAGAAAKSAIDFESSFAGIRKTVDATDEQFGMLAQGMRDLSKTIPVNVNELNRIGEAAGQLGIKTENILGFTEVMAKLGVATNLSSDQAATALARLANITQMPQSEFDRLGSTIVALGNNFATTESEITDFGLRIAGAGKIAGLSEHQILAIGAAMSSVGVEAEAGGTAVQKVLNGMTEAVATGGKNLEQFARTAGMSVEDFKRAFEQDAAGAFSAFVAGLGREGDQAFVTLDKLGLGNERVIRAFLSLANAGDLLTRALSEGAAAWRENSALSEEARKRFETTEKQLTLLWNRVKDVGITLGNALQPSIKLVVEGMTALLPLLEALAKVFTSLPAPMQLGAIGLAAIAAAAGPVLFIFGQLITTAGALAGAFGKAGIATKALASTYVALTAAAHTTAAALAGVTAAATIGIAAAYKLSDATHEAVQRAREGEATWRDLPSLLGNAISRGLFPFFEAWKDLKDLIAGFNQFYPQAKDTIVRTSQQIYEGVKTWLVDRFASVVESIKAKVELVSGAFADLYDKVVGHSYVPDLISGIAHHFGRLGAVMVAPVRSAVQSVEMAYQNMVATISRTLQDGFAAWVSSTASFGDALIGVWQNIASGVGNIVSSMTSNMLSALGSLAGPIGGILGGLAGGLIGLIGKKLFKTEQIAANRERDQALAGVAQRFDLVGTGGAGVGSTFNNVAAELTRATGEAGGGRLFQALIDADTPQKVQAAIAAITAELERYRAEVGKAAAAETQQQTALKATTEEFKKQQDAIKASIKALDDELASIDANEKPEKVMGTIEKRSRARIAEQKKKLESDLKDLNRRMEEAILAITKAATGGFGTIATKADGAFDSVVSDARDAARRIQDAFNIKFPELRINVGHSLPDIPGFAGGTPNLDFANFGRGRLVELHGQEAVVPKDRASDFAAKHGMTSPETVALLRSIDASLKAGQQIVVQADGTTIAMAVAKRLRSNSGGCRTEMREGLGVR